MTNPYEAPGSDTNPYEPPTGELFNPGGDRIRSLATRSVIFGLLGLFCCGPIFGPLAISNANQAESLIILDDSGTNYGGTYKVGRALGYVAVVLWIISLLFRLANLASH